MLARTGIANDEQLDWGDERPTKRSECLHRPRPCPWVSCKHNTALNVTRDGTIRIPGGRRLERGESERAEEFLELAAEYVADGTTNCALDLADEMPGGATQAEVAAELGVTPCRINQIEAPALSLLRGPMEPYRDSDE